MTILAKKHRRERLRGLRFGKRLAAGLFGGLTFGFLGSGMNVDQWIFADGTWSDSLFWQDGRIWANTGLFTNGTYWDAGVWYDAMGW